MIFFEVTLMLPHVFPQYRGERIISAGARLKYFAYTNDVTSHVLKVIGPRSVFLGIIRNERLSLITFIL